ARAPAPDRSRGDRGTGGDGLHVRGDGGHARPAVRRRGAESRAARARAPRGGNRAEAMNDNDERWLEIAGLIPDGKPVAWDTMPGDRPPDGPSIDALRVIADVADLHRAPAGETVRRWGTLAIQEQIGHGTFGDVYRARDSALDRDVALKLVDYTRSATAPDEGRLLARVRHSNVVTVHGAAIHDGRYGIWIGFIRGLTLAAAV